MTDPLRAVIGRLNELARLVSRLEHTEYQAPLRVSAADVSDPPTDAELDAALGEPSVLGGGFRALVDDGGAGADVWLVWTDGVSWFYVQGTAAV